MSSSRTYSVIICVYNRHEYLAAALESLDKQKLQPSEIIVVDDGSDREETRAYLRNLAATSDIRLVNTSHAGPSAARNLGRAKASGDYLIFFDDDDLLREDYISSIDEAIDQDPSLDVVYTRAVLLHGTQTTPWQLAPYDARRILVENMVYCAAAIRASAFDEVGGFDERLVNGREDHDLWIRCTAAEKNFHRVDRELFVYRQGTGTVNINAATTIDKIAQTYAQIAHNSPTYYVENIDVLWNEIFNLRSENTRYRRIYGRVDDVRRSAGNMGRRLKKIIVNK